MYDAIVVGAGYAGSISARKLAEECGAKVLLIDRRNHIAGNMYDEVDKEGVLVHKYGPHIPVMNEEKSYEFLSRFTEWNQYEHSVNAEIEGIEVPLPINFTSLDRLFDKKIAEEMKKKLVEEYGKDAQVPILQMRQSKDKVIQELGEYIFEKVFLHYTMKMWDLRPEEIDPSVTARIPVRLSYDDRHFTHKIQVMPKDGFTKLFENMLDHPNIDVKLEVDSKDILRIDVENKKVFYLGKEFNGQVIYTGALDYLFEYEYGVLPYRALEFEFETHRCDYIQDSPVLNWPDSRPATRRTEMKRLTNQMIEGVTTTITEYPGEYNKDANQWNEPYYPIITDACIELYNRYKSKLEGFDNFHLIGRLADYKYYNMEATILATFDKCEMDIIPKIKR